MIDELQKRHGYVVYAVVSVIRPEDEAFIETELRGAASDYSKSLILQFISSYYNIKWNQNPCQGLDFLNPQFTYRSYHR
jgi:hypothetical protein